MVMNYKNTRKQVTVKNILIEGFNNLYSHFYNE